VRSRKKPKPSIEILQGKRKIRGKGEPGNEKSLGAKKKSYRGPSFYHAGELETFSSLGRKEGLVRGSFPLGD